MSTSPELQSNFINHPPQGVVTEELELNGLVKKALVVDVLSAAVENNIELGGDQLGQAPEDPKALLQELRSDLMEHPDEPITLTDEQAHLVVDTVHKVAEKAGLASNEARYLLESWGLIEEQDSDDSQKLHIHDVIDPDVKERATEIRGKSAKQEADHYQEEVKHYHPTKPEPIYVDQSGNEIAQGEILKLSNPEEMMVTYRAVDLLRAEREAQGIFDNTSAKADLEGQLDEGKFVADLRGQEALFAREALSRVAAGEVDDANEELRSALKYDKDVATNMLEIRSQGPKQLEAVEINPDDEVVRTAKQHNLKPNLTVLEGGAHSSTQTVNLRENDLAA